jgi:phenylpropionate dioxygenase-like ring-hydroxylating dioxygenase large terminal subunit
MQIKAFIKNLIPFYYQISNTKEQNHAFTTKPKQLIFFEKPFLYYEFNHSVNILSDICPHQGAFLSKGWINKRGNIHCPYHGFEFDTDGRFMCIPKPELSKKGGRHCPLQKYDVFQNGKDLYLCPITKNTLPKYLPYYPPEHYEDSFIATSGTRVINQDYRVVTENVLDMLHISYVHSFGNINQPLPFNIEYEQTSNISGKTTFQYRPFNFTISMMMGNDTKVIVENEYHLPTTTITRVISGNIIKTVLTRSTPISKDKTLFFYTVYRNFWYVKLNGFEWVNHLFNLFMIIMMNITISEDIEILKKVDARYRVGKIVTKYDVTIQKYRETISRFLTQHKMMK